MTSGRGGNHGLHAAMADADHHVESAQVETLDRLRKQRQEIAIVSSGAGKVLDERGMEGETLDGWRDRARNVKQCEKFGFREALAQHLERFLTPTHARQPVVDERHPHEGGTPGSRSAAAGAAAAVGVATTAARAWAICQ